MVHAAEPNLADAETPVEVDVAAGDGAADSGRAARSHRRFHSPRSAAVEAFRGARAADLVDLKVDEHEHAADLGSTKEWTYGTSCPAPRGCRRASTSHPGLRSEIEANEIGIRKRGKGIGQRAEDRWSLITLVTPVAIDGDRRRRERHGGYR